MNDDEVNVYADGDIREYASKPIPTWLRISYYILIPLGILGLWYFWGGARGWFDRGHWYELEEAANTTFPLERSDLPNPADQSPYTRPLPD